MEKYNDFRNLKVWQKAFALLLKVYEVAIKFPLEETYSLTDYMRKSANSVIPNISEGYGRYESGDDTRFNKLYRGSPFEVIGKLLVTNAQNDRTKPESEEMIAGYKVVTAEVNALIFKLEKY